MSDRIDLQDIMRILTRLDERLGNIELKVEETGDGSGRYPSHSVSRATENTRNLDFEYDGCLDNVFNQRKELRELHPLLQKSKEECRDGLRKSASFQDKHRKKFTVINKRYSFSIPPDREEAKRISLFRRECLSNAIQWNFVDMVNSLNGIMFTLPDWLKTNDLRNIRNGKSEKSQVRRFLLILSEQNFGTMQEWLGGGWLEEPIVKMVWKTYEEFSDSETNTLTVKCFVCRLMKFFPADQVIDYLRSADILSKETYLRVDDSRLPLEAEDRIWKLIVAECRNYSFPKRVIDALAIALTDALQTQADVDEKGILGLLEDIRNHEGDYQLLLHCQCSELCSNSLHPVSVMKSMSMVQAYLPPSTSRRSMREVLSSCYASSSSPSSIDSTEKGSTDLDLKSSDEDQTFRKSVNQTPQHCDTDSLQIPVEKALEENNMPEGPSVISLPTVNMENCGIELDTTKMLPERLLSRETPRRKMSMKALKRREERHAYQSSSDAASDVDITNESMTRREMFSGKRCTTYTQQQTAQAMQNKPQIIYGKNVYISHV